MNQRTSEELVLKFGLWSSRLFPGSVSSSETFRKSNLNKQLKCLLQSLLIHGRMMAIRDDRVRNHQSVAFVYRWRLSSGELRNLENEREFFQRFSGEDCKIQFNSV